MPRFEAALLAHIQNRQDADRGATRIKLGGVVLSCAPDASSPDGSQPPGTFWEREMQRATGRAVASAMVDGDLLNKLGRYEKELMRQVERVLSEFGKSRSHIALPFSARPQARP